MEGINQPQDSNQPEIGFEQVQTQAQPEMSAEQQKMNELIRKLIDADTQLIVKVAACRCSDRHKCKVFQAAQRIAEIIDELQELRPST